MGWIYVVKSKFTIMGSTGTESDGKKLLETEN